MADSFTLLPIPRSIHKLEQFIDLPQQALIVISEASLFFAAKTAQRTLEDFAGVRWEIVVGENYPGAGLQLHIDSTMTHSQGYTLDSGSAPITIHGSDEAGVLYGVYTLRQIIQQYGTKLPGLHIEDWPDFPVRGVMLDISRDKVPTLHTILKLVDQLASWKINQLQLYMEHTFAYRHHPEVWAKATPFTGEEILELDAYCRERHIELVPNQNSLGHMERWLKLERYLPLAESPDGFEFPWGGHSEPTTLNPLDPGSIELVTSLYDELLPHFSSRKFNVGGDEPWELGKGKSKSEVEARGGRVYLDYLMKLYQETTKRGRQMQFWGDIIVHYPDLVPELPKDITAMLWGYEGGEAAEAEWERQCKMVADAGVPFYVCPGTSSWNSLAGRTENTIDNCRITARKGLEYGAVGYLITDWGDNGHWQPLPVSYLGFAFGTGVSWCYETNHDLDMPRALDLFAFEDKAEIMGKLAYNLGNVYLQYGPPHINGSGLVYALQTSKDNIETQHMPPMEERRAMIEQLRSISNHLNDIMRPINQAAIKRSDAPLIRAEFQQVTNLLQHSIRRLLLLLGEEDHAPDELRAELTGLIEQQRTIWLGRNRPGGLDDSIGRFKKLLDEYDHLAVAGR
jgi:hexosaminidase